DRLNICDNQSGMTSSSRSCFLRQASGTCRVLVIGKRGTSVMRLGFATLFAGTLLAAFAVAQDSSPRVELGPNADLGGRRLLPDHSPWHRDISKDPVDPNSARILARVGWDKPLHPDFGPTWEGAPIGIPYVVVSKDQRRVPVQFTYAEESDPGP